MGPVQSASVYTYIMSEVPWVIGLPPTVEYDVR